MARKHGFFRPHVAGLSGIYSTTLRDGVGGLSLNFSAARNSQYFLLIF